MLPRHGEILLRELSVLSRERTVRGCEVHVRATGYDTIAARDTPFVGLILVGDDVHGGIVGGIVEGSFSFEIVDVEFHLLELTELREPWLRGIPEDEVGDLEGVGGADDVEIGLIVEDVVVQRALGGLLDAWAVAALVRVIERGLQIAGCTDYYFERTILVKDVIKEIIVVAYLRWVSVSSGMIRTAKKGELITATRVGRIQEAPE
jgi:hypothetical protein